MKGTSYIFVWLLVVSNVYAQQDSSVLRNSNGKTLKRIAENALKQNDPNTAIFYLETYTKQYKQDANGKFLLGIAYMQVRDYDRSQRMFLNAYNTDKKKSAEALYFHALMQKSNSKYDSAKVNFQKFKKEYKGKEKALKRQATKEIAYCDSVSKIIKLKNKILVQHLDTTINKVHVEAAPLNLDENTMVYTSFRTEEREFSEEGSTQTKQRKLYVARKKNGKWKFDGEFAENINSEEYNTGNAALSPDKKRMYFTRCKPNFKGEMICAIYVSEFIDKAWSEPVRLPKEINNPKYTSTMPAITTDPVKGNEIIYFVSNRKGKGKLDIWYSVYDKKKKSYKPARNAGIKLNTPQNEITPYFDNDTRTLYFSSDGLGGLGGYDIYRVKGNGNKWGLPENVGQPLNSGADDIYYSLSPSRNEGFFVSNRKGGNALKNSTCCDDIYAFKNGDYVKVSLKGNVTDMMDKHDMVKDAVVEIYIKDKFTGSKLLVKTTKTNSLGNYQANLEAGQQYYVLVKKPEYLGSSFEVSTEEVFSYKEIGEDLHLVKKPKAAVRIPNVTYESDKSKISEKGKMVLDSTVLKLMLENPEIIVEIQAHTDSKGSEQYNLKLSQKRAEEAVNYLLSKGINPQRLVPKGYGESLPIAPNENSDGTDNPVGRAKNRRTDFKIVGVLDSELINESQVD